MKRSPSGSDFFPFTADLLRLIQAIVFLLVSFDIHTMCSIRMLADLVQSVNLTSLHSDTFPYG